MFAVFSSTASVTNATIHKYLFVVDLVGENPHKFSRAHINTFMFFIQFWWPLIGILIALRIDFFPAKTVEESKEVSLSRDAKLVCESCNLQDKFLIESKNV